MWLHGPGSGLRATQVTPAWLRGSPPPRGSTKRAGFPPCRCTKAARSPPVRHSAGGHLLLRVRTGRGGSLGPSDEPDLVAALRDAGVLVGGHDVGFSEHGVRGAQELPEEPDLPQNRLLGGYPVENPTGKGNNVSLQSHQMLFITPAMVSHPSAHRGATTSPGNVANIGVTWLSPGAAPSR